MLYMRWCAELLEYAPASSLEEGGGGGGGGGWKRKRKASVLKVWVLFMCAWVPTCLAGYTQQGGGEGYVCMGALDLVPTCLAGYTQQGGGEGYVCMGALDLVPTCLAGYTQQGGGEGYRYTGFCKIFATELEDRRPKIVPYFEEVVE